ncbi:MAG: Coenzyme F420 hydrogenase/dehydrogenase, beta subunit C-terminal domain [Microbacterium sp.]
MNLERQIGRVLERDACSGCGLCAMLDAAVRMNLDDRGYLRPSVGSGVATSREAAALFRRCCPGIRHDARRLTGARRHPMFGPYLDMWEAWAVDPEIRERGSSGGVLTALNAWLVESGIVAGVASASADPRGPARTVPVTITTKEEALAAAGSRYAPVGVAGLGSSGGALAGKPCEVAAVRAHAQAVGEPAPILLSFFCAGTPSQHATAKLVRELGGPGSDEVTDLWYRGRGWPGRFTARFRGGEVSADYEESWGKTLGPMTQWRCKICPDGVGESADITAADAWESTADGYPSFAEQDGRSALIARTERGLALVLAARDAGVIELRAMDPEKLERAQPLQISRRTFLLARLWGARLAGRGVPSYRGFGLLRLIVHYPRDAVRTLRGSYRRVKRSRG